MRFRTLSWLLAPLVLITCTQTVDVVGVGGMPSTGGSSSSSTSTITGIVSHGSSSSTGSSGMPICADVSGPFVVDTTTASCTSPSYLPGAACIVQEGCNVTLALDIGTLTGTVSGDTITVSGPAAIGGTTVVQYACTGTVQGNTASLQCTSGSVTCSVPATRLAPASGVDSYCCDPLHPTCASGAHCTFTSPPAPVWFTSCVPESGTKALGESCTSTDYGFDDCGPGLFCAFYGHAGNDSRCLRFCDKASDCASTEVCLGGGVLPAGSCVSNCTPLGTDCPTGTSCHPFWVVDGSGLVKYGAGSFCSPVGHLAPGTACVANSQCEANMVCGTAGKCAPMCDATHPCATGTCTPMGYVAPNAGVGFCN